MSEGRGPHIFGEPIGQEPSRGGGSGPLIAVVVILLVPAVALLALWQFASGRDTTSDVVPVEPTVPSPGSSSPRISEPLATGMLSWRRVAGPLARDVSLGALRSEVADFTGTLNDSSCAEVRVGTSPVGERNPQLPVLPASSHKVVTGSVALDVLGPKHRFTTSVHGELGPDGTVTGDLFVVGGGDPLLTTDAFPLERYAPAPFNTTSLDELADAVVDAGVTAVSGRVVGDGSRYDDQWFQPTWVPEDRGTEAGPVDALLVNDARSTIDQSIAGDPAQGAAREFAALLEARGVTIERGIATGTTPGDAAEIATIRSAPLTGVVAEMLTTSDDNTAEMLLKELDAQRGSTPATWAGGLEVVEQTLRSWNVPMEGVRLVDGSGLSTQNRLTCDVLMALLARHGVNTPVGNGLAVAGETGTLADVFVGTPVEGRLRAKTGTLYNRPYDQDPPAAKALVGYLPTSGGPITFTLVLNGPSISLDAEYVPVWDRMATVLASYPAGPSAEALAPRGGGGS